MTAVALVSRGASETEFLSIYNRLCVALREQQDESGITQQVYFDALKDLSPEALDGGAAALMKQRGRKWFPTTAEWRAEADVARVAALRQVLKPSREEGWTHECTDCDDSGWILGLTCDGGTACGRKRKHLPHTWTQPCPCRMTNRTYQRHQNFGGGAA